MSDWSEIATAPKNGERVFLAYQNGTVKVGYWDDGARYWSAGQWMHETPPTHWMRLPLHPSKQSKAVAV